MQIVGILAYLITALLAFWIDWRVGVAFIKFLNGFKIELFNTQEEK
jgi:hypothetical protein